MKTVQSELPGEFFAKSTNVSSKNILENWNLSTQACLMPLEQHRVRRGRQGLVVTRLYFEYRQRRNSMFVEGLFKSSWWFFHHIYKTITKNVHESPGSSLWTVWKAALFPNIDANVWFISVVQSLQYYLALSLICKYRTAQKVFFTPASFICLSQ